MTRNIDIVKDVKVCKGPSALRGLMLKRPLENDQGVLLVVPRSGTYESSIHTFFVFFNIDVIWLDKNFLVVDIAKKIRPFTPLKKSKVPAKYVLELFAGTISEKGVKPGDQLEFIN